MHTWLVVITCALCLLTGALFVRALQILDRQIMWEQRVDIGAMHRYI